MRHYFVVSSKLAAFPLLPITLYFSLFSLFLSLALPLFCPHLAVANLIYMYFYTFSSLLRARKLATG